ncbi:riboflavin synthase subunit alpha [Candidatus Tenderia electrophaga]|jgi:riboflavin synthase|uniref:Riboflavin synthase n=1 Tax=Candidatus Tenderia electrophaga TaxID=1748243 RepID=A0A0S2T9Q5_9GAMM|nr:riboflavin synthase subunit alpha [Candidatus Tenderia electrophaga]
MFTGIIEASGDIAVLEKRADDSRLRINAGGLDMADVKLGDSIAIDGVCLTVVDFDRHGFSVDVSAETLDKTTLGEYMPGRKVNLEKALQVSARLGGHLVSGHVDGVGVIESRQPLGESLCFQVRVPDVLAKYIAVKGSVCIDGVSLTVNRVEGAVFEINIIPHTAAVTTIGRYQAGRRVNIEVDIIARYLERLLLGEQAAARGAAGLTLETLMQHGFIKS